MEHRDSKKSDIIKSAATYFYQYGYKDCKLRDIASECGLTHVTIYKHFSNKEDLGGFFIKRYMQNLTCFLQEYSRSYKKSDAFLLYWLMHFSMVCSDKKFGKFFYEYLKYANDSFLEIEIQYSFPSSNELIGLKIFGEKLNLNLEILNLIGGKLGEYCISKELSCTEAVIYICKFMDIINGGQFNYSDESIRCFIHKIPGNEHFCNYDMINDVITTK